MFDIFLYIIIGIAGGIIGGMGMGGGTLLIPLLTIFTAVNQHTAQAINLAAFLPMAVVVLIIHIKNKLVKYKYLLLIALPALLTTVAGSFIGKYVSNAILAKCFGVFLIVLGIYQFITALRQKNKKNSAKKQNTV